MGELKPFVTLIDVLPFRLISMGHTASHRSIKGAPPVHPHERTDLRKSDSSMGHSSFTDVNGQRLSTHLDPIERMYLNQIGRTPFHRIITRASVHLGIQVIKGISLLINGNNWLHDGETYDCLVGPDAIEFAFRRFLSIETAPLETVLCYFGSYRVRERSKKSNTELEFELCDYRVAFFDRLFIHTRVTAVVISVTIIISFHGEISNCLEHRCYCV